MKHVLHRMHNIQNKATQPKYIMVQKTIPSYISLKTQVYRISNEHSIIFGDMPNTRSQSFFHATLADNSILYLKEWTRMTKLYITDVVLPVMHTKKVYMSTLFRNEVYP